MQNSNDTQRSLLKTFLGWWLDGLRVPFSAKPADNVVIAGYEDGASLHRVGPDGTEPISKAMLDALRRGSLRRRVFLSVPESMTISMAVPISKRDLPVAEAARLLMPFDADEIWCCSIQHGAKMLAVPRAELEPHIEACRRQGLVLRGIAFANDSEIRYVEFTSSDGVPVVETKSIARLRRVALSAVILSVALVGSVFYWWQQQGDQQSRLAQQLKRAAGEGTASGVDFFNLSATLANPHGMSASKSHQYFSELVTILPVDAVAYQAILSNGDLILDMKARSSSLVRTQIDVSKLFSSSEFVSAISADSKRDEERFRLKLTLAEPGHSGAKKEGIDD